MNFTEETEYRNKLAKCETLKFELSVYAVYTSESESGERTIKYDNHEQVVYRKSLLSYIQSYLQNEISLDDSIEIFDWLNMNGIRNNVLFDDVLLDICGGSTAMLTKILLIAIRELRKTNGISLAVINSHPVTFLKSICEEIINRESINTSE